MTKSEAIEILNNIPTKGEEVEAIEIAISALEKEAGAAREGGGGMTNCTGINCPMQVGKVDPATCAAKDCPYRTVPVTNADRIRAMSDEELAEAIFKIFCHDEEGSYCPPDEMFCKKYGFSCRDCWLDWLRQEAAEPPKDHPAPICQTCGNFETCPWRHEGIFSGPPYKARRVLDCSDYKTE